MTDWTITFDTVLDFASAAGIGILSIPAFSLNMNKRALTRIRNLVQARDTSGDKSALDIIARELESEASGRVSQWRRIDEICLRVGYFLLLGAAILRIFA